MEERHRRGVGKGVGLPPRCGPLAGPSLKGPDGLPPLRGHGRGVGYG